MEKEKTMEELELVFYNRSTLLEGPSWDKERNGILCVSIEQNCVYYLFLETGVVRTYQMDSQVGCAVFKDENTILAACYSGIYEIDFESGDKKFIVNINEDALLRYNDGKMDPKGRFIVGTTGYKCLAEKENFLYSMENEKVRVLEEGTTISNGIGFSKDGKYMYFVDTPTRKVFRYDYDINTGFEITFDPELEIYIKTLDELGYDLNDDYSVYFDENGRPYNSSELESVHWINDITMVDENGQRVVNSEYVRKIVDRLLSRDKERICVISQ